MTTIDLSRLLTTAAKHKLGHTTLLTLTLLYEARERAGDCETPTTLAPKLGLSSAALTHATDKLVNRFLITRTHCDKDRRKLLLEITPKGSALLAEIIGTPVATPGLRYTR